MKHLVFKNHLLLIVHKRSTTFPPRLALILGLPFLIVLTPHIPLQDYQKVGGCQFVTGIFLLVGAKSFLRIFFTVYSTLAAITGGWLLATL